MNQAERMLDIGRMFLLEDKEEFAKEACSKFRKQLQTEYIVAAIALAKAPETTQLKAMMDEWTLQQVYTELCAK